MRWLRVGVLLVLVLLAMRVVSWALQLAFRFAGLRPDLAILFGTSPPSGCSAFVWWNLVPGEPLDPAELLFGLVVYGLFWLFGPLLAPFHPPGLSHSAVGALRPTRCSKRSPFPCRQNGLTFPHRPAFKPQRPGRHLKVRKDGMEGLAGAVLGETIIPIRDDEDRRAVERRLVREAQNGDLLAFERLYRENVRKVFGLCLRMSQDASLAEELTQEVFVKAWRKLSTFRGESAFSSWLYPMAVNVALSERRSRRRRDARIVPAEDPARKEEDAARAAARGGLRPRAGARALPPGARPCSCSTTWRAGRTRRSRRC